MMHYEHCLSQHTELNDFDRRIDAAVEHAIRPYRAALVQAMELLGKYEMELPGFAVDSLPREAVEMRKANGTWIVGRPLPKEGDGE